MPITSSICACSILLLLLFLQFFKEIFPIILIITINWLIIVFHHEWHLKFSKKKLEQILSSKFIVFVFVFRIISPIIIEFDLSFQFFSATIIVSQIIFLLKNKIDIWAKHSVCLCLWIFSMIELMFNHIIIWLIINRMYFLKFYHPLLSFSHDDEKNLVNLYHPLSSHQFFVSLITIDNNDDVPKVWIFFNFFKLNFCLEEKYFFLLRKSVRIFLFWIFFLFLVESISVFTKIIVIVFLLVFC